MTSLYFPPLSVKSSELQTIKTELTQIKSNIDALLGRLEQIAEEQKANPGQLPRVLAQISEQGHRAERGEDDARGREGAVASDPTWTHLAEALVLPRCSPGQVPQVDFYSPFLIPFPEDGKKKGESSSGGGSGGGSGSSGTGGSSRPPAPPEDTASEAGTPQGEAQARDDGDEEGLLTHSEEELVRACLGGWLGLGCVPLVAGGLQGVGGDLLTACSPCVRPPSLPGVLIL